jgi:prophage antirepressor-like protein
MEQLFKNKELHDAFVRITKRDNEILFYVKDVALSIGYSNTKKAIRDYVWAEDKRTLGELRRGSSEGVPRVTPSARVIRTQFSLQNRV